MNSKKYSDDTVWRDAHKHLMDTFHRLTRTAISTMDVWRGIINLTGPPKREIQSTVTAADSCDGGISVLNHCLSSSKFLDTHLSHSRQWFNIHLSDPNSPKCGQHSILMLHWIDCPSTTKLKAWVEIFGRLLHWNHFLCQVSQKFPDKFVAQVVQCNSLVWIMPTSTATTRPRFQCSPSCSKNES